MKQRNSIFIGYEGESLAIGRKFEIFNVPLDVIRKIFVLAGA
jgi:hypothetical protein